MTDNAIIEKVRKLLNLADPSRGGTDAERDTAMKMAQKLMFEHDLELYEIGEESGQATEVTHTTQRVEGKTHQWQGMLLHYIGGPFNCKLIYTKHGVNLTVWTIVGTPDNIKAVQELHKALVPWLKSQASIARRAVMPRNPNAFNRAFFDTAGKVIARRLREQQDYLKNAHTKGTDMVLARDAQNERYAESMFANLRQSRRRGYSNHQGAQHGHSAGHRADISPKKLA